MRSEKIKVYGSTDNTYSVSSSDSSFLLKVVILMKYLACLSYGVSWSALLMMSIVFFYCLMEVRLDLDLFIKSSDRLI